ncbi:MAG TPA: hypothetical protein VF613_00325 [Longimicrobium sp.]|jgi:hypothetical protein
MRTLILQSVVAALYLVYGAAALAAARRMGSAWQSNRLAWYLTGWTFTLFALCSAVQHAFSFPAYFGGPGSYVYVQYLRWAPVANHSRTFLVLGYCAGVAVLIARRRTANNGLRPFLIASLLVMSVLGALYGWHEGSLREQYHFSAVAVLDAVELVILLSCLFAALVTEAVDRLLWYALGTYTFNVALNIIWMIALAGWGVGWTPAPWQMQAYRTVLGAVAAGLAVRRYVLARRGVFVPGLIGDGPRRPALLTG